MKVAFIVNMRAGNFKGRRIWEQLKQQLTISYTLYETAKISDGILEVTVVNRMPRLKFLALFLTVFKAKHTKFKEVTQFQVTQTLFTMDMLVPIHTDGENRLITSPKVHCEVVPKSIKVVQ